MRPITEWFRRQFADPQVTMLVVVLLLGLIAIVFIGQMLAPVIAAIVIAYLLEVPVRLLERAGLPRLAAVLVVFIAFMATLLFLILGLIPLLSRQIAQLVAQLPLMIGQAQEILLRLPEEYPHFITEEQINEFTAALRAQLAEVGQWLLSLTVAWVVNVIYLGVYLVLVPLMVFFFLKDRDRILGWLASFLPPDATLVLHVWSEVNHQIANYVRGKFYEIVIVGAVTYLVFSALELQFAALLAALTGLSVIIPFIGAAVVAVPVTLIAYFQWGLTSEFAVAVGAYFVIQAIDGNVLAPLLVSGVVNLHPIAVIVAILVFGGIWGFWGVFFAVPLATLVQVVLRAWPRAPRAPPAEEMPRRPEAA